MMKIIKGTISIVVLMFLTLPIFSQYSLVEKQNLGEGRMRNSIPYTKYELNNGLVVLISEDHTDPSVNVNLTYKIGSTLSYGDRTGMTYLIYELMKEGSNNIKAETYKKILKSYYGSFSSEITKNLTQFSINAPSNLLETALWLESDKMGNFIDSISNDRFLNKIEEIAQFILDSISRSEYGEAGVYAEKYLYQNAHPYSWPVFGEIGHYSSIELADLKEYFLQWYGPNNAILTISGDVVTEDAIELVNQYFGYFGASPKSFNDFENMMTAVDMSIDNELTKDRYVTISKNVERPSLLIYYRTPDKMDQSYVSLNILSEFLNQKKDGAVLYDFLIKSKLAKSFNVEYKPYLHLGEFVIEVDAEYNIPLKRIKDTIQLALLKTFPIPDPEKPEMGNDGTNHYDYTNPEIMDYLAGLTAKMKLEMAEGIESNKKKADELSFYESFTGSADQYQFVVKNIMANGPALVNKMVNAYIIDQPALYISLVPATKKNLAVAEQNYSFPILQTIIKHATEEDLVINHKPQVVVAPKIKKAPINKTPVFSKSTLENGVKVIKVENNEVDNLNIEVKIRLTNFEYYQDASVAAEFVSLLYKSFFANKTSPLGRINFSALDFEITHNGPDVIFSLSGNSDDLMLMKEMLSQLLFVGDRPVPDLNEFFRQAFSDFDIEKYNKLQLIPNVLFPYVKHTGEYSMPVFTEDTPFEAIRDFYTDYAMKLINNMGAVVKPQNTVLIVSGKVEGGNYVDLLEAFRQWGMMSGREAKAGKNKKKDPNAIVPAKGVYVFNRLGLNDPEVVFVYNTEDSVDFKTNIYNDFLKVVIAQNLNKDISFNSTSFKGTDKYYISFSEDDNLKKTITNIEDLMVKFSQEKFKCKDFRQLKKYFYHNNLTQFELNEQKGDLSYYLVTHDLGQNYFKDYHKASKKIRRGKFKKFVANNINPDDYKIIVIGNKAEMTKIFEGTNYSKIFEINNKGQLIK